MIVERLARTCNHVFFSEGRYIVEKGIDAHMGVFITLPCRRLAAILAKLIGIALLLFCTWWVVVADLAAILKKAWLSSLGIIIHVRHTAAGSKSENRESNQRRIERTPPEKSGNACDYADQWAMALFMALSALRYHHINPRSPFPLPRSSLFCSFSLTHFFPSLSNYPARAHEPNIFPLYN